MWLLQGVLVTVFPKWTESFMVLVMLELLWEGCCFCRARSVLSVVLARNSYVDTVIYFSGCESGRTACCGQLWCWSGLVIWSHQHCSVCRSGLCAGLQTSREMVHRGSKQGPQEVLLIWPASCFLVSPFSLVLMAVTLCFSLPRGDTTDVTKNLPGCDVLACGFSPLWAIV